jgi:hypothetical protein
MHCRTCSGKRKSAKNVDGEIVIVAAGGLPDLRYLLAGDRG